MQSRRALHQWNAQWQRGTMRAAAHVARCAVQEMLRVQRCCGGRRGLHNSAEPSSFAPPASETAVSAHDARLLADFIAPGGVVCVTGAGISTASGIPDYRSARGSYSKGHVPVQHMEFLSNEEKRKRYWARSLAGYKYFASRQPNSAHFAVAALQAAGLVTGVITQNVDQLHTHAGSGNVIDLHGTNDKVECQSCGARHERWAFQEEVEARNRAWILANLQGPGALGGAEVDIRADGDANLSHEDFRGFEVPGCRACGGVVMPTVVFFGGVIPKERKESAREMMRAASRILVLGTSCEVGSVFHLVRGALEKEPPEHLKLGVDLAIVNIGQTRLERDLAPALAGWWCISWCICRGKFMHMHTHTHIHPPTYAHERRRAPAMNSVALGYALRMRRKACKTPQGRGRVQ